MNTVDFCVLSAIGITALIGIARGFIRELSSIMAWVLAGVATFWDVPFVNAFMRSHFESSFLADIITTVAVFLIAFIIVSLIGTVCASFIRGSMISPIDRLFGALLGSTKGIILISCLELISVCFVARNEMPSMIQQSVLIPYIYNLSDFVRSTLPDKARNFLDDLTYKNGSMTLAQAQASRPVSPAKEGGDKLKELSTLIPKNPAGEEGSYTQTQQAHLNKILEKEVEQTEPPLQSESD